MTKIFQIKNNLILLMFFLAFSLFLGIDVRAEIDKSKVEIDIEYPVGTSLSGEEIFGVDNIFPGWEISKNIKINNHGSEKVDLFFNFKISSGYKLAEKLKLYVIRDLDDKYFIGSELEGVSLLEINNKNLYIDKLAGESGKIYRIKIKFDESAGNEYQRLETEFDIDFEIEEEISGANNNEDEDEDEYNEDSEETISGLFFTQEVQGAFSSEDQIERDSSENQSAVGEAGLQTENGDEAKVLGDWYERSIFKNWKFWLILFLAIAFSGWIVYRRKENK